MFDPFVILLTHSSRCWQTFNGLKVTLHYIYIYINIYTFEPLLCARSRLIISMLLSSFSLMLQYLGGDILPCFNNIQICNGSQSRIGGKKKEKTMNSSVQRIIKFCYLLGIMESVIVPRTFLYAVLIPNNK